MERVKKLPLIILLILMGMVYAGCERSLPPNTFLLVMDTSGSMGGKDKLIEDVKASVDEILEKSIKSGDKVCVYTFDEELEKLAEKTIESDEDKKELKSVLEGVSVRKKNTDIAYMLAGLQEESKRLEEEGVEQVIIVLSDGKDAPDPGKARKKVALDEYKSEKPGPVTGKNIYYVSLTDAQNDETIKDVKKRFPTGKVKTYKTDKSASAGSGKSGASAGSGEGAGGDGGTSSGSGTDGSTSSGDGSGAGGDTKKSRTPGFMSDLLGDIEQNRWWEFVKTYWPYGLALLLLLLLLLLIYILMRNYRIKNKLKGYLYYYEDGISFPNKSVYNLNRLNSNKLKVGSRSGVSLRIKDLGIPQDFNFVGKKVKNDTFLKPVGKTSSLIQIGGEGNKEKLTFGDTFKIGNYIFEYSEERE